VVAESGLKSPLPPQGPMTAHLRAPRAGRAPSISGSAVVGAAESRGSSGKLLLPGSGASPGSCVGGGAEVFPVTAAAQPFFSAASMGTAPPPFFSSTADGAVTAGNTSSGGGGGRGLMGAFSSKPRAERAPRAQRTQRKPTSEK
jgi:hypothetical protein